MVNVSEWIKQVTTELDLAGLYYGHGTGNPSDEAAWLVMHAVGAPLDGSFSDWGQVVTTEQEQCIQEILTQRTRQAIPLAYILQSGWFAGLEFEVCPAVLVPRSPIAELILEQFQPWIAPQSVSRVLDLCTGSGCIGIATAVCMPWVRVDATDISPEALAVARKNIAKHAVGDRVTLIESDLFSALPLSQYDLIVANPPYVPLAAIRDLPTEYRAEPELGLVSGEDGLDACLEILASAARYLAPQGMLVCEVGESETRLQNVLPSVPFIWLEFDNGGSGVFVLARQELLHSAVAIEALIEERRNVV
jgi:ribosomal protein L3 glutamine methyltransferase